MVLLALTTVELPVVVVASAKLVADGANLTENALTLLTTMLAQKTNTLMNPENVMLLLVI
jgi:hypothetical protein